MTFDALISAAAHFASQSLQVLAYVGMITVAGLLIERLLPAEPNQPWPRLRFNLLAVPIVFLLGGLVASKVAPLIGGITGPTHPGWLHIAFIDGFWGSLAGIAVYMLIYDFFYYWWHRAQHESSWLWQQHRLHHSDRAINISSAMRHHWLESPLRVFTTTLPMLLLFDLKNPDVAWLVTIFGFWPFFIHMNLRLSLGPLTPVLAGPQYHRLHHSLHPEHHNKNYAAYLPLWDIVFRTAYLPKPDEFPPTGLDDGEDTHLWHMLWAPFGVWWRRLRGREAPLPAPGAGE